MFPDHFLLPAISLSQQVFWPGGLHFPFEGMSHASLSLVRGRLSSFSVLTFPDVHCFLLGSDSCAYPCHPENGLGICSYRDQILPVGVSWIDYDAWTCSMRLPILQPILPSVRLALFVEGVEPPWRPYSAAPSWRELADVDPGRRSPDPFPDPYALEIGYLQHGYWDLGCASWTGTNVAVPM